MTNSLSYVPDLMGGPDQGRRVDLMGGLSRGPRVELMGARSRGPRVDLMGGPSRGPRVDLMGGPDPARYPQAMRDRAPRSVDFRFRSAKGGPGRGPSEAASKS